MVNKNRKLVGSPDYLKDLHSHSLIGEWMTFTGHYSYYDGIRATYLGDRIKTAFKEILGDLKAHEDILSFLDTKDRTEMLKMLSGLNAICNKFRLQVNEYQDCLKLFTPKRSTAPPWNPDREIDEAIKKINNGISQAHNLNHTEREETVKKTCEKGVFTPSSPAKLIACNIFIMDLMGKNDIDFLETVWTKYLYIKGRYIPVGIKNRKNFATEDYIDYYENLVFKKSISKKYSKIDKKYLEMVMTVLTELRDWILDDLEIGYKRNERITNTDYIKNLLGASIQLERCGIKCDGLKAALDKVEKSKSSLSEEQKKYAALVYAEAGGKNIKTKQAVAHSIKNRVVLGHWTSPTTIEDAISYSFQYEAYGNNRYNAAMEFYNTGGVSNDTLNISLEIAAMQESLEVITPIYSGIESDFTGGVKYFHSFINASDWPYHNSYILVNIPGTEGFWWYKE